MTSRVEQAVQKKAEGYNCAQAVACTYCDLVHVDEDTMRRITGALGAGMGNMEGTCGAITGACILAGFSPKMGPGFSRRIMTDFKESNGSVTCKELKGVGTGKVLRGCSDCVRDAASFVEQAMFTE